MGPRVRLRLRLGPLAQTLAPMKNKETLEAFAANFVIPEMRERFVHEAIKKPKKLHARICHGIEEVFPSKYKENVVPFAPDGPCLFIGWRQALEELTWSDASKEAGLGGGILIIDISGRKFYAESEGAPHVHSWAGVS